MYLGITRMYVCINHSRYTKHSQSSFIKSRSRPTPSLRLSLSPPPAEHTLHTLPFIHLVRSFCPSVPPSVRLSLFLSHIHNTHNLPLFFSLFSKTIQHLHPPLLLSTHQSTFPEAVQLRVKVWIRTEGWLKKIYDRFPPALNSLYKILIRVSNGW